MSWTGRKVLVTGAGGFIGSHLTEKLVELGADVRALVHYNALGTWGWLDESTVRSSIEVVSGDICDADVVRASVRGRDTVFHLAALIGIPYSYLAPASYVRTNIEGTLNVLQACRDLATARVVHTSTSEVYGTPVRLPIDEAHPLRGQSPYSASKIGADKIAEAFHLSFGVPVVTLRPFNTFGPRQSARAVVPTIITQLLSGDTVRLGSVHPKRDLNFVSNTVDAFLAAAAAPDAVGRTINVGSGSEISVEDLARQLAGIVGRPLAIETSADRVRPERSEVERLVADHSLASELLGWHPDVSLQEGLERTVAWFRDHIDRYRQGIYAV